MLGVSVVIPRSQDKCVRFSGAGVRGLCKPSVTDARNRTLVLQKQMLLIFGPSLQPQHPVFKPKSNIINYCSSFQTMTITDRMK